MSGFRISKKYKNRILIIDDVVYFSCSRCHKLFAIKNLDDIDLEEHTTFTAVRKHLQSEALELTDLYIHNEYYLCINCVPENNYYAKENATAFWKGYAAAVELLQSGVFRSPPNPYNFYSCSDAFYTGAQCALHDALYDIVNKNNTGEFLRTDNDEKKYYPEVRLLTWS